MPVATWLPYLQEFRQRIIRCILVWLVIFLPGLYYANTLYHYFALPLIHLLPSGHHLVVTKLTYSFTTPMHLVFQMSLWVTMPFFLYQLWHFVAPALYKKEKILVQSTLVASIGLFYIGMLFAFFVVCPMTLKFFIFLTPLDVKIMTDIQHYLDFVLSLLWAFGLAFQVPIVTWILLHTRILTPERLRDWRPYVIIGAFTLGMLLTPPDVLSQILLALPLWGLFELGLAVYAFQHRAAPHNR